MGLCGWFGTADAHAMSEQIAALHAHGDAAEH
jgi:hypothetical protein